MSFNVVIDSNDALTSSASIYDKDYAFDWSVLEEGEYDLTFSFLTSPIAQGTSDVKAVSLEGLGTQRTTYKAGANTNAQTSQIIGLLNRVNYNDGTARQRFQQSDTNPVVCLKSRPNSNIFKVRIVANSTTTANAGLSGSYLLILTFIKREYK